ncbi:MAG TPA: cytochrome D1 domain-containing protein [Pyrinomonadaceae bacterium]|nr:cytochrome D1 domain-containing protein [Pyrinomonadaceae bacterium]
MKKIVIFLFLILINVINIFAGTLVVLNKDDSNLAIIDTETMKIIAKIPTGNSPHEVVLSADGKTAFVANYGAQTPGSSLSVIDLEAKKELRRVDLSPLLRPHGLQGIGGKIYFTAETNRVIARYDPVANKVDWLMGTGQNLSHMLVGSADQKRFYTANIGSDSVTVFEFASIPPAQSKIAQIAVGKQPEAIDLSPNGNEVWVGLNVDKAVDVIDTTTNKVVQRITLDERPYRERFTPDGKFVVMTMPNTKELIVIEAATRKETKRIKLESAPLGIVFSKNGKTAFISAVQADVVLKIDMEKGTILSQVETGKVPDGIALTEM